MCLAIAPKPQSRNGPIHRLWKKLSATPARLLGFGAGLHLAAWALLIAADLVPATEFARGIFAFSLVYGILGAVLLGYLLTSVPQWLGRGAIHPGWYGGAYLAFLLGLALMEAGGLFLGAGWAVWGTALVLFAWFLGCRVLVQERFWATGTLRWVITAFTGILAIGMAAILAFSIGLAANWVALMQAGIHGGIWLVLMPSLFGVAFMTWRVGGGFAFQGRRPR